MNTILLITIAIVGLAVFLVFAKGNKESGDYSYQLSVYLLTKAERSFYGVLAQAVGNTGLVFCKVRVADVISPQKGLNRSQWQRAFNAVSAKHLDFLICDPADCSVKLAIELDDSSHGSAKTQKRDHFLNAACESAGLPLLRVKASQAYVLADIRRQIAEAINPPQAVSPMPSALEAPEAAVAGAFVAEENALDSVEAPESAVQKKSGPSVDPNEPATPSCPKCGSPMLLRKVKSGDKAGQEFWGCSTFPKCRGMARYEA